MGVGVGVRELLVVVAVAVTGLLFAVFAALTPWYPASPASRTPIVTVVDPGGVAERR